MVLPTQKARLFIHAEKDNTGNSNFFLFLFFCSCDGSSEPVPSTSSEPDDIRQHTQDGKQTSQESASTNERQI